MNIKSILKILLASLLAFAFYFFRSEISEDETHAFLMALCAGMVCISFFVWPEVAGNQEISIGTKFRIKFAHVPYLIFSFFFAYLVLKNYCSYFFDDTAFTLRYLDNFLEGYFYHYNKLDPPVFGISSFLYGICTGFLCWIKLFTPEQSIHYTTYAGTILLGFLVFKILRELIKDLELILLLWFAVMFNSKMFLNVIPSGMESPFQVAILFTALLFFFQNKSKWMWSFLALSVISKLDAVPVAMVTGSFYLLLNRKALFPLNFKNKIVKEILLFAGLPILLWLIFAFVVFGSPLPQSAYSKIFFHAHASDYWFPFLTYYVQDGAKVLVFWIFCALYASHLIYAFISGIQNNLKSLIFGACFFATLTLFYFYNPGEKMQWYYVLPDLLLAMQLVLSFYTLLTLLPYKIPRLLVAGVAFFYLIGFAGTDIIGGKYWMDGYLDNVERERKEVGIYIGNLLGEKDSLLSNHALLARHVKGYVIDMSGLNSKFATNYRLNMDSMINDHHPKWGIYHTSPGYAAQMCGHGYSPVRTFYDITNYSYPEWTLFKRNDNPAEKSNFVPLDSANIKGASQHPDGSIVRYESDSMSIDLGNSDATQMALFFGVKRTVDSFDLKICQYAGDSLLNSQIKRIKAIADYPQDSKYTEGVQVFKASPNVRKINIFAAQKGSQFTVIDPFLFTKK